MDELLSHPIVGTSWEGFAIENILSVLPDGGEYWYYKTSAGAEIDLVINYKNHIWAIEIKRTLSPKASKGFLISSEDIQATERLLVYAGSEMYPITGDVIAISLKGVMEKLVNLD